MSQQLGPGPDPPAARLTVLMDAALDLATAHSFDDVLSRVVARAAAVAGARYAALGVYDDTGVITQFVHHGLDDDTVAGMGHLPEGRGLLGETIAASGPVSVDEIRGDPRSVGFPPRHPEMHSFLGVPIRSGDRPHGNLYVTDKIDGDTFDETDQRLLGALAAFAACAVDNNLLVQAEHDRVAALERLAAMEETDARRQELLEQVIGAQEAERARVARDLHDQIGQSLSSILIALRVYENAGPGTPDGRKRGEELRELITDTLDEVRQLAFELRPAVLDDIGLVTALQRLGDALHQRLGLDITWHVSGVDDEHRLPSHIETAVYRIAQEALTNVARHSGVLAARATLSSTTTMLVLEIHDRGRGFDAESARDSLGLVGMSERAALVGGVLSVSSRPGEGTAVHLEVPR